MATINRGQGRTRPVFDPERIVTRLRNVGAQMPSELAGRFAVQENTIRVALRQLAAEGRVEFVRVGRGFAARIPTAQFQPTPSCYHRSGWAEIHSD